MSIGLRLHSTTKHVTVNFAVSEESRKLLEGLHGLSKSRFLEVFRQTTQYEYG